MAEPGQLTKVYRPLGARMVSAVSAGVLIALVAFLWLMLPERVRGEFDWFQRGTLIAFFVAVLVVLYGIFRTRVDVSERGVSVTNGYRHYDFDWPEIVSISLTPHRPWALVDLADGSTRAVMALQTSDGPRATRSAQEIGAMISARSATEPDG
jgi:hypothetical protein